MRGRFPPVFSPGLVILRRETELVLSLSKERIQSHFARPGLPPPLRLRAPPLKTWMLRMLIACLRSQISFPQFPNAQIFK